MAKKPRKRPPITGGAVVEPKLDPSTMLEARARARETATPDAANTKRPHLIPHRWKKGQSGNPNGRPKSTDEMKKRFQSMTELATDIIEMKATLQRLRLEKAIDILSDPKATLEDFNLAVEVIEGTDMNAVQAILDRGHGKPQQKIHVDHREVFDDLSPDEFESWLLNTGQRVTQLMIARRNQKANSDDEGRT